MKYTCIVWDFNGTIIDDVAIGIDSVNTLLSKRGLKNLMSREEYQKVFGFPIIDYYRRLGFEFDKEPYETIAVEWVDEYTKREKNASTVEGAVDLLECFKEMGLKQVVISACEKEMLVRNAKMLGVYDYFDEICGIDNIYASSKVDIALQWRKKNPLEKLLFIGDTDHDLAVSNAIEADCVLVSEGHQSYEKLIGFSDRAVVVKKMSDIKSLIN